MGMQGLLVVVLSYGVLCALGQSLCDDFPCCDLQSSADNCSIANMPASPSTLVYPGGNTRCIYSSSGPYAFQVWPGSSSHLVINFQGGGACWNKQATGGNFCTLSVSPEAEIGAFDRTNSDNQFTKYTIVYVNYCSGDMHAGNVTRSYNDPSGNPIQQTGIYNVEAVLTWIESQQKMGQLATKFEQFVIMGDSAGSIASQVWSFHLLNRFSYEKAAVIPDSYIGVFPPNTQGPLIYNFGACNSSYLPPDLYSKCAAQELTLQDFVVYTLPLFPEIPFAYIQSKTDATQMSFYVALAASLGKKPYISQSQFYSEANEIMSMYNQFDNFIVFEVDGSHHTFTPMKIYYSAGTLGPTQGSGPSFPMVVDWVNTVPFTTDNGSISSECEGESWDEGDTEKPKGNTYCDSGVYPKTFSEE